MKRQTFAVFMTLWLGCVTFAAAQQAAPPPGAGKGKLGYGFAPGLVPGEDFVAGQLIVGLKDGVSIRGLQNVRQTADSGAGKGGPGNSGQCCPAGVCLGTGRTGCRPGASQRCPRWLLWSVMASCASRHVRCRHRPGA